MWATASTATLTECAAQVLAPRAGVFADCRVCQLFALAPGTVAVLIPLVDIAAAFWILRRPRSVAGAVERWAQCTPRVQGSRMDNVGGLVWNVSMALKGGFMGDYPITRRQALLSLPALATAPKVFA